FLSATSRLILDAEHRIFEQPRPFGASAGSFGPSREPRLGLVETKPEKRARPIYLNLTKRLNEMSCLPSEGGHVFWQWRSSSANELTLVIQLSCQSWFQRNVKCESCRVCGAH